MSNYLLDTNVIIGLEQFKRGQKEVSPTFISEIETILNQPNVMICVSMISIAELAVFIKANDWQQKRINNLVRLLSTMMLVDFGYQLIPHYINTDLFSRGVGRKMAKNDLWIVATAKHHELTLVTCDTDFGHLTNTPLCDVKILSNT